MDPSPACRPSEKNNPVLLAFQSDVKDFKRHLKKIATSPNIDSRFYSRGSYKLLEIWNKYRARLPFLYFEEHWLQTADFLVDLKFFRLALWQGYGFFVQQICTASLESIKDVKDFTQLFSTEGLAVDSAKLMFRALQGKCRCIFYLEKAKGALLNTSGIQKLLKILGFLRILMQAVLPNESLCCTLYNGTLLIYSICRFLMSLGHTSQVLEYLLWSCACLEISVPLLTAQLVPWRATLYCAVCECYYHQQEFVQAEVFARRALGKISELAKLVELTGSEMTQKAQQEFKEATVKLAVVVFKRAVYEHRRKPKDHFRLKQKINIKEIQLGSWPRTPTERILMDMFEGNAAQFLAVLEALRDGSIRTLQNGIPEELEIQEVVLELISAGISLLSGFGDKRPQLDNDLPLSVKAVVPEFGLLEMAVAEKCQIPLDAVMAFAKQLFRFEQWAVFSSLSSDLFFVFSNMESRMVKKAEKELVFLEAAKCVLMTQRVKFIARDSPVNEKSTAPAVMTEEFFNLIHTLHACVCTTDKDLRPDADLVQDTIQFFWAKCRSVFQTAQTSADPVRYLGKVENQEKWVETLFLLCEVVLAHQVAEVDLILVAELTLKLALVLESNAECKAQSGRKTATTEDMGEDSVRRPACLLYMKSSTELWQMALGFVEQAVECVSRIRTRMFQGDCAVFDVVFMQKFADCTPSMKSKAHESSNSMEHMAFSMDLHLELLVLQHRLFLKLSDFKPENEMSQMEGKKSSSQPQAPETSPPLDEASFLKTIQTNKISKSIFLAQKALLAFRKDQTNSESMAMLEVAMTLMEKAELEEKRLVGCTLKPQSSSEGMESPQPPPIPNVLSRSNHSMTFTPSPYSHHEEVCWYSIYGREAEGVVLKVRLKDCGLPGTGEMVSAEGECLLLVSGLEPNKKYIFAVAAFNAQGKLVGSAIGETTRPLLCALPLPLLTSWAHLAQVAHQTGLYALARKACNVLWEHFTLPSNSYKIHNCLDGLAETRLRLDTLQLASHLLRQLFCSTIFIHTDAQVQEQALFCDSLFDGTSMIWAQETRLSESDRMLVALDLCLHLGDTGGALQAVVGCYGLLAPLIYYQIPSETITEVLLKCFTVLLELPDLLRKRPAATAESLQHMVACITYYLIKNLLFSREEVASSVAELGQKLLQQINKKHLKSSKKALPKEHKEVTSSGEEPCQQLKALNTIAMKYKMEGALESCDVTSSNETETVCSLTGSEDPIILHAVIQNSDLQNAFENVMKFSEKSCFLEMVVNLLQKAMANNALDLVLMLEQAVFNHFSRGDGALPEDKKLPRQPGERSKEFRSSLPEDDSKKHKERKTTEKKRLSGLSSQHSKREHSEKVIALIRRCLKRWKLKRMCYRDSLWRAHINLNLACAHFCLLKRKLAPPSQSSFSHLPLSLFSLAHCGSLIMWKSDLQHIIPSECVKAKPQSRESPSISNGFSDAPQTDNELLDMLKKACDYIRRSMVLAHRWGHWTTLQWACQTLWDQLYTLVQQDAEKHLLTENLYSVITPLLVLASDLLMDMMDTLKLWNIYDDEERYMEASLCFSALMDDGTVFDLRWIRSLVLHTLELLHYQEKWETLAHLALLFNSYTRECYSHTVTPILVHAQRKLLERIHSCGGPPVPQPHFTQTEEISGVKVTCRNYAGLQLLSITGASLWDVPICQLANKNKPELEKISEMERAVCLVCVPLDVEDTLGCFKESLEKRHQALEKFQHSQTLLLLLLADTQHSRVKLPFSKKSPSCSPGNVEFNLTFSFQPSIGPVDQSAEDFSSLGSIYHTTLSSSQLQTVLSSYSSTIKYLQEHKHNSLLVQALHDLGNLHFYNGNHKAAHSCWCKALDAALQTSSVLESWESGSWNGSLYQETLRRSGIWCCHQAALLSAKIAQHIMTSNIGKRTKCCLLSAHLFKCLLVASMPHPVTDSSYSVYCMKDDLIPGLDVFVEADQLNLAATVASLSFVCHWLHSSGHHLKALPLLTLFLYVSCTMCRDPSLTVSCRILKVKVLADLGFFTQAITELNSLTLGRKIPLLQGGYHRAEKPCWAERQFSESRSVLDASNRQVLEDVINRKPSEDVTILYGSRVIKLLLVARVHLISALCRTIRDLPEPHTLALSESTEEHTTSSEEQSEVFQLIAEDLTLGKIKTALLTEAYALISPELSTTQDLTSDPEELELAVEVRLLMSTIKMQQGNSSTRTDLAISALSLLQNSPVFQSDSSRICSPGPAFSSLRRSKVKPHQQASSRSSVLHPLAQDLPAEVEAKERMGGLLWLRCRLAVVSSLVSHVPGTTIFSGAERSAEAFGLLKQGLLEAEAWGDPETKALLLLQGVQLNTLRGRPKEDSVFMLQEVVSSLSGRSGLSLQSQTAFAEAALHLSELRGTKSPTLLLVAQKILQQQLYDLGETVNLRGDGVATLPAQGLKNIHLHQIPLLAKATMRIGHSLAVQALLGPTGGGPELFMLACEVLQSALGISQCSANREPQLEGDVFYCLGVLGRHMITMQKSDPHSVLKSLMACLTTFSLVHSHNLWLMNRCYMEMALVYLHETENSDNLKTKKDLYPLLFWVCLRIALKVSEVSAKCANLNQFTSLNEECLPPNIIKVLPNFALNDLFHSSGRSRHPEDSAVDIEEENPQLTWVQLSRYYLHLLNLLHVSSRPGAMQGADWLLSVSGDPTLPPRLSQLQTFFVSHLKTYNEQICIPVPPVDLVKEPPLIQPELLQRLSNLYPWLTTHKELCIHWYRHTSEDSEVLLLFAMNKARQMKTSPRGEVLTGQKVLSWNGLKAVHSLLSSACEDLENMNSPFASFSLEDKDKNKAAEKKEVVVKKVTCVCKKILTFLKPDSSSESKDDQMKLPFDPGMDVLQNLEQCFNPATGSTVREAALINWLCPLLT